MQITYRREGGIAYLPGLRRPLQVDTRAMPDDEAARLEGLVAAAAAVAQAAAPPAPGSADHYTYTLEVKVGRRRSVMRMHDPLEAPELRALVAYFEELRAAQGAGAP